MSMRMELTPELELTDEQKLDYVFFHIANERGMLREMHVALFGNGHPEDGLMYVVRHSIVRGWKSLWYDIIKQTATVLLTSALLGLAALTWFGAMSKLQIVLGATH